MVLQDEVLRYVVSADDSIMSALKKMDNNALRNLIVINQSKVVGILTDGDVRRALIKGVQIHEYVRKAMKTPFIYLLQDDSPQAIIEKFRKKSIGIVPIINGEGELSNVLTRKMFEEMILYNKISTTFDINDFDNDETEYEISPRPWGYYKTMVLNEYFQSKVIYVLPDQLLSLQSHMKREEYWTIICGEGEAQIGESKKVILPGDVVFIPKGCKHNNRSYSFVQRYGK